jgi:hypothetical protein
MNKSIQFKNKIITRTKCCNNIERFFNLATPEEKKRVWYAVERAFCDDLAVKYRIDIGVSTGIVSAISPQKGWEENKKQARKFCATGSCGATNDNVKKARRIFNSKGTDQEIWSILNGNKTQRFFNNLLYPYSSDYVTIDRHAINVVLGRVPNENEHRLTDRQYVFMEDCYKRTAKKLGLIPSTLQSITWEACRRLNIGDRNV